MLNRTVLWVVVFAGLLAVIGGMTFLPGWLVAIVVMAAVPLGLRAGVRQKRMERDLVRAGWRALTTRRAERQKGRQWLACSRTPGGPRGAPPAPCVMHRDESSPTNCSTPGNLSASAGNKQPVLPVRELDGKTAGDVEGWASLRQEALARPTNNGVGLGTG